VEARAGLELSEIVQIHQSRAETQVLVVDWLRRVTVAPHEALGNAAGRHMGVLLVADLPHIGRFVLCKLDSRISFLDEAKMKAWKRFTVSFKAW
jgi:hypothetical protein